MMTTEQERKIRQVLADLATNVEAAYIAGNVYSGGGSRVSPGEAREQRRSAIALAFGQIAMIVEPAYEVPGNGVWTARGVGGLPPAKQDEEDSAP